MRLAGLRSALIFCRDRGMDRVHTPDDFMFQLTYAMAPSQDQRRYDGALADLDSGRPQARGVRIRSVPPVQIEGEPRDRGKAGSRPRVGGKPAARNGTRAPTQQGTGLGTGRVQPYDVLQAVLNKQFRGRFAGYDVGAVVGKAMEEVAAEAKVPSLGVYVAGLDVYTCKLVVNEVHRKAVRMLTYKLRKDKKKYDS